MLLKMLTVIAGILASTGVASLASAQVHHALWQELLSKHVNQGKVQYKGLLAERTTLQRYLTQLENTDLQQKSREEQMAFWINAYNAAVIGGVLNHWPVQSVKEVKKFFDSRDYKIAGEPKSLNEIEKHLRRFGDPRIHFALVCASQSCPALVNAPYQGDSLDRQLDSQAKKFLRDPQKGLRIDRGKKILWISKIFQWHEEDFVQNGIKNPSDLITAVGIFLDEDVRQEVKKNPYQIRYLDYDWRLND
ncbi:MAG: DUF547 domain-containing protein [Candidatus Omnitrophica bacterium]|nr:DUF547 domain-containing protein [Candidatus Omnitrophota bacterium]